MPTPANAPTSPEPSMTHAALATEVEPKADPLSLFAVDANSLIARLQEAGTNDINGAVRELLTDRRAA